MTKLENDIFNCLEKIINNLGYELYDVIYEKQGKENHLCIFIDKQNGINIEDCEIVNNAINDVLDEKNFIKDQYYLEVSSTGLEKRIRSDKHLENAINTKVRISLYKPINKERELIGTLLSFDNESLKIMNDTDELIIERKNISKITTYYDFSLSLGGVK